MSIGRKIRRISTDNATNEVVTEAAIDPLGISVARNYSSGEVAGVSANLAADALQLAFGRL